MEGGILIRLSPMPVLERPGLTKEEEGKKCAEAFRRPAATGDNCPCAGF